MTNRIQRIDELLREELSRLLEEDAEQLGMVAVVAVRTTRDLSYSRVLISPVSTQDPQIVLRQLTERASFYRHRLLKHLNLHRIPQLQFDLGENEEEYFRVEALLDQIEERSKDA